MTPADPGTTPADPRGTSADRRMTPADPRRAPRDLPELCVPVTRTLVVAGAVATRDYQDVHHDAEAARAKGSPDVFMNILTTSGLVGRYVAECFGPRAVPRSLRLRLGVPSRPGDDLTFTGRVTAAEGDVLTVEITGTNRLGRHVTAAVTLEVPPCGE